MSKIGEPYKGIWPEKPVQPTLGMWVRYPEPGTAVVRRAKVECVGKLAILLATEGGRFDWCWVEQISADED